MADGRVLAVGASGDPGAVFAALAQAYTPHADPAEVLRWTWLDTADWRLHRNGLALREERRGRRRELVLDEPSGEPRTAAVSAVSWPARLDQLADSPVRSRVAEVVGVRALLPVAEVETRRILLRLLDDAGKTRVRVSVEQQRLLSPRRAALPLHVVVRALRGYDDDAQRCVDLITAATAAGSTTLSPTAAALAAAGHLPGAAEAQVTLRPDDPAVRPVAHALLADVAIVDATRDGAIADLDTEFLHDLRSAIRSTRALLGAAGHVLLGRSAVRVERDLAWLEEMTTPLRAVDIALLEIAGAGGLDLSGIDPIDALRDQLQRHRRNELRRMRQTLRAARAPAAFTAWRRDLRGMVDVDVIGPSAAETARVLAADACAAVGAGTGDLGVRLAALRAVLAAFGQLYPPVAAARVASDVEALYDLVRRRDGARIAQAQVRRAAAAPALARDDLLAAGAVIDRAAAHEHRLEDEIAVRLAKFGQRKSRQRIAALTA